MITMINGRELRIGNIVWCNTFMYVQSVVLYPKTARSTESIDVHLKDPKFDEETGIYKASNIVAVPLDSTEVTCKEMLPNTYNFLVEIGNNLLLIMDKRGRFANIVEARGKFKNPIPPIKTMHQLQNFYFAFTGKELTFKINV